MNSNLFFENTKLTQGAIAGSQKPEEVRDTTAGNGRSKQSSYHCNKGDLSQTWCNSNSSEMETCASVKNG